MRFPDFRFASVLLLACLLPAALEAQDAEPTPTPESSEQAILGDIPIGETFEGVRVPQTDVHGNLIMLFDTKSATRIDDSHIQMEDLKIEIHNEDRTTFHVEMPDSVFDLDTRILSGSPATIRREDFTINGDRVEFHTKTKFGRMTGNVKMTIFNTDNIE